MSFSLRSHAEVLRSAMQSVGKGFGAIHVRAGAEALNSRAVESLRSVSTMPRDGKSLILETAGGGIGSDHVVKEL